MTGLNAPRRLFPWLKKTRALRPDAALDFQGLLRSALIGRLSGARQFWGMSDSREGSRLLYHRVAKVNRRAHAVERYLKLAEAFGATVREPIRFPLPTGDELPRFDPYPPFVVLHPFARGARKSLSNDVIDDFCRAFAPTRVVLVGKTSRRLNPPDNCVNLANQTTLLQLIWLIRAAQFTISVDSGPMHIAAAISPQLVSIHTWSDPRRVGPYEPDAWIWRRGELIKASDLPEKGKLKRGRAFTETDVSGIVDLITGSKPTTSAA